MEYININENYDDFDRPVYLSDEQIDVFLSYLPKPFSADSYENNLIHESQKENFREILKSYKVAPSALASMAQIMVDEFAKTKIYPGLSVGEHASSGSLHGVMQASLNSVAPWEKLLVQDHHGKGYLVEIGSWIDVLMDKNKDKIELIPKNRTQLLELDAPFYIPSCNENGIATWNVITHVTKHLPKGDLVKIKTDSGREVTATQSKSLLKWDGKKIIPVKGKDIKVGDRVPILNEFPEPPKVYEELDLSLYLDKKEWINMPDGYLSEKIKLDRKFGRIVGLYLGDGCATNTCIAISKNDGFIRQIIYDWCNSMKIGYHIVVETVDIGTKIDIIIHSVLFAHLFKKWVRTGSFEKIMPDEILFGNQEFITGILDGYISGDGSVRQDGSIILTSDSKALIEGIAYLCGRLGFFGKISNNHGTKNIKYTYNFSIESGYTEKYLKHNNVMLDEIISIEYVKDVEYVYDLTVPDTLNFSTYTLINMRDSFHISGQSRGKTAGITGVEEILYARKERKVEICTLHYKNKNLTYEQVLESRKDIVGCMFSDFVKDYLYTHDGANYTKHYDIDYYKNLEKRWWHQEYYINSVLNANIPPEDVYVLRITFNTKVMYEYKVTLKDLAAVLQREHESPLCILYGPIQDGIMDIYTHADYEEKINGDIELTNLGCENEKIQKDVISAAWYQNILIPSFNTLRVKGVQGINNLIPIVTPVISVILKDTEVWWLISQELNEQSPVIKFFQLLSFTIQYPPNITLIKMPNYDNIEDLININKEVYESLTPLEFIELVMSEEDDKLLNEWYKVVKNLEFKKVHVVILNKRKLQNSGVNEDLLEKLFNLVGIKIEYRTELHKHPQWYVTMPNYSALLVTQQAEIKEKEYLKLTPSGLIKKLLSFDEEYVKKEKLPYTALMHAAEVIHAEVSGKNLRGLLALPFLDQKLLQSNNMHVIASVLGIRAARAFFIKDLYEVLSNYSLHPQHVLLIADVFFSKGQPVGAEAYSKTKQIDPIDKASVAKAVEVFKSSAIQGVQHKISGVAPHVAFGLVPRVGTGYFDIGLQKKGTMLLNKEIFNTLKVSEKIHELVNAEDEIEPEFIVQEPIKLVKKTRAAKPVIKPVIKPSIKTTKAVTTRRK